MYVESDSKYSSGKMKLSASPLFFFFVSGVGGWSLAVAALEVSGVVLPPCLLVLPWILELSPSTARRTSQLLRLETPLGPAGTVANRPGHSGEEREGLVRTAVPDSGSDSPPPLSGQSD